MRTKEQTAVSRKVSEEAPESVSASPSVEAWGADTVPLRSANERDTTSEPVALEPKARKPETDRQLVELVVSGGPAPSWGRRFLLAAGGVAFLGVLTLVLASAALQGSGHDQGSPARTVRAEPLRRPPAKGVELVVGNGRTAAARERRRARGRPDGHSLRRTRRQHDDGGRHRRRDAGGRATDSSSASAAAPHDEESAPELEAAPEPTPEPQPVEDSPEPEPEVVPAPEPEPEPVEESPAAAPPSEAPQEVSPTSEFRGGLER